MVTLQTKFKKEKKSKKKEGEGPRELAVLVERDRDVIQIDKESKFERETLQSSKL